ncbi:MAG: 30S ribosomal protein S17 [Saprospiraceae bacterium]
MAEEIKEVQEAPAEKMRKTRVGVVSSAAMDKSITVLIERKLRHPIYGKFVKKSKKLMAHDETNDCNVGDTVKIQECRPLSKRKRWKLVEVLERAK